MFGLKIGKQVLIESVLQLARYTIHLARPVSARSKRLDSADGSVDVSPLGY